MSKKPIKDFIMGVWCPPKGEVIPNGTLPPDHYKSNALVIECSENSNILCIDFDIDEKTEMPEYTQKWVDEVIDFDNDWICFSNKYTLDDIKTGKFRFKVFFRFNGEGFVKNQVNVRKTSIEIFYSKPNSRNKHIKFAGARGKDEYDNIYFNFNKELRYLPCNPNDYLPNKCKIIMDDVVTNDKIIKNEVVKSKAKTVFYNPSESDEEVNKDEFIEILSKLHIDVPKNITVQEKLLTFPCLFMDEHSNPNGANAYAFKRNGTYVAKCQGEVCSTSYFDLNLQFKNYTSNLDYDLDCEFKNIVADTTIFKAPTGWGKTENIAKHILNSINQTDKKLLILMPDKGSISRLLDRVNFYSNGKTDLLLSVGKLYNYSSENTGEGFQDKVDKASVIISHHHYFKNCGDIFTKFKKTEYILTQPNLEVIIDESHSFIELITRNILEVGGLYEEQKFNKVSTYKANRRAIVNNFTDDAGQPKLDKFLMANQNYRFRSDCISISKNDYGTVQLRKDYDLNNQVSYLDIVSEVRNKFTLMEVKNVDNVTFMYYANPNIAVMGNNEFGDALHPIDLLLDPAEYCILALNNGDGIARKQIGNVTALFYQNQILTEIMQHKVIFVSATFSEYHIDEISKIDPNYIMNDIKADIDKVNNLILLSTSDDNASRVRKEKLEFIQSLAVNSLVYLSTIDSCKRALKYLPYAELNDNGYHTYVKFREDDFGDKKYMTLAGLESTVSKGYNFLTEIDGDGFSLMYFDTVPVSPAIIKMYVKNGRLTSYSYDYQLNVFAQAIGRAFRKKKDNLTLCFNRVDAETVSEIERYLEFNTNAKIVKGDLTNPNIRVSLSKYINESGGVDELKTKHRNNKLFRELYLNDNKSEEEI